MTAAAPTQTSRRAAPLGFALALIALAALPLAHPPPFFESFLYLIFFWIALSTSCVQIAIALLFWVRLNRRLAELSSAEASEEATA